MENHDLLTAAAAAIEHFREEVHRYENEVDIAQAKLEIAREALAFLSGKPKVRRGRPPRTDLQSLQGESRSNIAEMPSRVAGGMAMAEVEPETAA